jgi:hypothetical protein
MASRNVASVTTAGSGNPSISVAHVGTVTEKYVNAFAAVAVPCGLVTSTELEPTDPAGVTAVTVVDDTATTFVPGAPPIVTLVAPLRLVPVIVIAVPPSTDPVFGLTDEIVGGSKGALATRNPTCPVVSYGVA